MSDDNKMESMILEMVNQLGGVEQFQSNPFAFIGEIFKHPDLLMKLDRLAKTPEMQEQIAKSMDNPMFQQIIGNNPMLSGMMNQYRAHQSKNATPDDVTPNENELVTDVGESLVDGLEFSIPGWRQIDWLNPQSNQPFYVSDDPQKRVHFSDVLDELPEECRERVEIIAQKRLSMHLNAMQQERLEAIASRYQLTALDLMCTQGFIGEVCYCATLVMPDDDLCDLAKFALSSLSRRSGYPVSSYLVQIMLYLDSFDSIEIQDWENFVWSLSANPIAGRDGNFMISMDDARLILDIANDNLSDHPELLIAVMISLLGWSMLSLKDVPSPVQSMIDGVGHQQEIAEMLVDFMGGKKIYAITFFNMRQEVKNDILQFIMNRGAFEKLLSNASHWSSSQDSAARMIVDKLDLLWNKVDADVRDRFIKHAIEMDSEPLALSAIKVGFAWEPEKYRMIALDSPYQTVKAWVDKL